ncbi:MAG: sigma-54 dependent transcriptional regulator [Planctomycetota bacterium]
MSPRQELLDRLRGLIDEARELDDAALWAEMRALLDGPFAAAADDEDFPIWQGIVGACPPLIELRGRVEKFARVAAPVLIRGESGTGKDLVAHALHDLGPRRELPFVGENCASIPETLLESVLFGHVKGAFTGAVRDHPGHFVAAHKGTLFLDEIGDMPLAMQVKLLRVLQEGEVRPVGGSKTRKIDVRVVAATNKDLAAMVGAGGFREDLFYRLNVLELTLPALRERGDDAILLARWFLRQSAERGGRRLALSPAAEQAIGAAPWPGNIRQLQNEMQRVAALCDGDVVEPKDLSL